MRNKPSASLSARRLSVVALALGAILAFLAMVTGFLAGPELWSTLRSPDIGSECSQIQSGMSRQQTLQLIHVRTLPEDEFFDEQGRLFFSREAGVCIVEFDADRETVTSARFEVATIRLVP